MRLRSAENLVDRHSMLNLKQPLIRICYLTLQDHSSIYVSGDQFYHARGIYKSILVAENLEPPLLGFLLLVIIPENPVFVSMC